MASRHSGRAINFYFLFLVVHKEDDSQNRKKFQVSTGRRIVIGYFTFKWGFENSKKRGGGMCERLIIWMAFGIYDFLHLIRFLWPPFFFFLYHAGIHLLFSLQKKTNIHVLFQKDLAQPPTHTHTQTRSCTIHNRFDFLPSSLPTTIQSGDITTKIKIYLDLTY